METQDENSKMMPAGRVICYSCKLASKYAHSPNFPGQASPHVLLSLASCWQQQMKKAKGKAVSRRKIRAVCSPPSGLSQFLTPPGGGSPSRDDFREGRDWRQWPLISSLTAERLNVPELENYQATKLLPRRVLCVCVGGTFFRMPSPGGDPALKRGKQPRENFISRSFSSSFYLPIFN